MAYDIIKKNVYFDPPDEYQHSSRNHAEDLKDFHVPMHKLHDAAVHGRGIASGLEVSGAAGAAELVIDPGVAVDGTGQMIVLASPTSNQSNSGRGDISPQAPGDLAPVAVPVHLPLAAFAGQKVYVTIQYSDILDPNEGSGGRQVQTPWIRLQPTSGVGAYVDNGGSVILAIASINAAGALTALAESDGALAYGRVTLGVPVSEVRVRRSLNSANKLQETPAGKLRAGVGGGLQLTVPAANDTISVQRENGQQLGTLDVRANTVQYRDSGNRDVFHFDANNSWLRIGALGNEGDLVILDQRGNEGMAFSSSTARLDIGTNQNPGHFNMRNTNATITMSIDGATGAVKTNSIVPFSGNQVTVTATQLHAHATDLILDGVSQNGNRALSDIGGRLVINRNNAYPNGVRIDGVLSDSSGFALMGNPARKVRVVFLFATRGSTDIQTIDLGSSKRFTAFTTTTLIDSESGFDRDNATSLDIFSIDGNQVGGNVNGGDHWGSPGASSNHKFALVSTSGRNITFRARCFGPDAVLAGLGIVFFE
jgi:hypothetical protein